MEAWGCGEGRREVGYHAWCGPDFQETGGPRAVWPWLEAETTMGWKRFHLTCLIWGVPIEEWWGGERVSGVSEPSAVC